MEKFPVLINCSCVDATRKLSLPAFFRMVEDFDTVDAEKLGIGKKVTMDQGRLWVFTRVYFEFYKYPTYLEEAEFRTYSAPKNLFVFPRHDELRSKEGELLIKGSSYWALLDEKTRRAIFKTELETPDFRDGSELPAPKKVAAKESKLVREHVVSYSDVDLNRHLNNTRYIEMIVDCLGDEFLSRNEAATLLINYDSEIRPGEKVSLFMSEDRTYLKGEVDGRECFQVEMSFRPSRG